MFITFINIDQSCILPLTIKKYFHIIQSVVRNQIQDYVYMGSCNRISNFGLTCEASRGAPHGPIFKISCLKWFWWHWNNSISKSNCYHIPGVHNEFFSTPLHSEGLFPEFQQKYDSLIATFDFDMLSWLNDKR